MELNLDAVAKALEKIMSPVSTSDPPNNASNEKIKSSFSKRLSSVSKPASNTTHHAHTKPSLEENATREILVSKRKTKMLPRQPQTLAERFVPSSTSIPCNVVEATGTGASIVIVNGNSLSRRFGDKFWSVNLYQYPKPYIVLNSLPRHYFRKEVISHIESTVHTQGERIERVRDVVLTIVVEPSTESVGADGETVSIIEGVVVSCSNHPRTGYVNVVRIKDIKSSVVRVVVPGTLVGPFLKLTLLPKGILQSKVLKVGVIELAHADSWTERHVIEEPLKVEGDVCDLGDQEKVSQLELEHITSNNHLSVKEQKTQYRENISAMQDSGSVSSVKSAQEDAESINEKKSTKETHENMKKLRAVQRTIDAGPLATSFVERNKEGTMPYKCENSHVVLGEELKKNDGQFFINNRESAAISSSGPSLLRSEVETEGVYRKVAVQPSLVNGSFEDDETKNGDDSTASVSKALIAWSVKRRLLQDKNIMRILRRDFCNSNFMEYSKHSDEEKLPDRITIGEDGQMSFQLLQARNVWESANYWGRRDILLEAMIKSTAICVTIARTQNEVLASMPQPYPLQILLVLSEVQPSEQDCFDLMMTVAHGERRCGRDAELVCRMADGFACKLHPHHRTDSGIKWILVSLQGYYTQVNEWMMEMLRVHDDLVLQGDKRLHYEKEVGENELHPTMYDDLQTSILRPPALRSVLDFAGMFEVILPALRPWLDKSSLHYYGDVQPVLKPFIDECGIIRPTSWFQCELQATVRSVLLNLPGANEVQPLGMSTPPLTPMPTHTSAPTVRRSLVCAVLHQHVPFFAVWQPELQAVKVVLTTAHVLHHIDSLDGLMMDDVGVELVKSIAPQNSGKVRPINDDFALRNPDSVAFGQVYSDGRESTSPLAFQLLGTALRHSWNVVGLALPALTSTRHLFDEDTFMDTVMRWNYTFPRAVVIFYCEAGESTRFSPGFVGAFAPVDDLHSALSA